MSMCCYAFKNESILRTESESDFFFLQLFRTKLYEGLVFIVLYLLFAEESFIDSIFEDSSSSGRTLPVMLKMFNIFLFDEMILICSNLTRD